MKFVKFKTRNSKTKLEIFEFVKFFELHKLENHFRVSSFSSFWCVNFTIEIQTWIDFKVEADPALLELAYAVRIAEERHPINDNDNDFNK